LAGRLHLRYCNPLGEKESQNQEEKVAEQSRGWFKFHSCVLRRESHDYIL
jgi:hypothetical protein